MLSSLSRLFQPSTSSLPLDRSRERDPLAGAEAGRSSEEANSSAERHSQSAEHVNGHRISLDAHSDSTPLLTRKQSLQLSSAPNTPSAADAHFPAPPHVFWKTQGLQQNGQDSPTKSVSGVSMFLSTPTTSGWGAQPMNRSASSPSLLLSPSHASASAPSSALASQGHRPSSSLGRQSLRSMRLAVDSMYASEDSDAESERSVRNGNGAHLPVSLKQLSPIHEQQFPFPPHRKLSLDSVPRTPDSARTFDRINGHNAFINRPLKRSVSQTSTSTHLSNISSATPPVIPPLDLRPNFQNAMGVPHGRLSPILTQPASVPIPRKSRLAAPSLPTVVGSPRQANKVSVIYEDGASASARTSSFITAPSVSLATPTAEPGHRFSFGRELDFGHGNIYFDPSSFASDSARDEGETDAGQTEVTDVTDATHRVLPAGLYDVDLSGAGTDGEQEYGRESGHMFARTPSRPNSRTGLRPGNPTPSSTHSHSHPGSLSVPRQSSRGSSFFDNLDRRWLKGISFGEERFVLPPSAQKQQQQGRITYACILFWVGFVMPWCWLIGGWLLTRDGDVCEEERGPLLPLWHKKTRRQCVNVKEAGGEVKPELEKLHGDGGKGKRQAGDETEKPMPMPDKVKDAAERRIKGKSWYPLLAPSLESLAPSDKSGGSTRRLKRCLSRSARGTDPWIRRCRVAAAVSGVLILAVFIVAIVIIAGVRV